MKNFKNWVTLTENIIIDDVAGGEASLHVVSPNLIREFNYDEEERAHATYFIAAYQARRIGYLTVNSQPTHIGITKTSAIEQGKGADVAFIKALVTNLQGAGLKPIPYKEGESNWAGTMKQLGIDDGIQNSFKNAAEKDKSLAQTPNISKGSSNMTKITGGMSVSRASGSWSYFIKAWNAERILDSVLQIMEKSIQPMIENDIVRRYEIVERMTGKRLKSVSSKAGAEQQRGWEDEQTKNVAYIKYLAEAMLKNHPHAKKLVLDRVNQVGVKVIGGGGNPKATIQPANNRVPIDTLIMYVNQSYAEDHVILFFLHMLKSSNEHMFNVFDSVAQEKNAPVLLWQVDQLINNKTGYIFDNIGLYLHDAVEIFKNQDILRELIPQQFNEFRTQYEEAVNQFVQSEGHLEPREIKYLKILAQYIDIQHEKELDRLHGEITKREDEEKQTRATKQERQKFILNEETTKYLVFKGNKTTWENVPSKYLDRDGEVYHGEFCLNEIVDAEEVFYAAHEKASEEAYANAEERKSANYGEDADDVNDDIEAYADDFINSTDAEIPGDISDEDLYALIKNNYYKEFIKWRKKELEEEEEEDKWKYEPEPDEQDIWKHQEELAVDVAFDEYGLVILNHQTNDITIELNSKFKTNLMPILKKSLEITTKEKDPEFNEPILRMSTKVRLTYRDQEKDLVTTVYHMLTSE